MFIIKFEDNKYFGKFGGGCGQRTLYIVDDTREAKFYKSHKSASKSIEKIKTKMLSKKWLKKDVKGRIKSGMTKEAAIKESNECVGYLKKRAVKVVEIDINIIEK